MTLLNEGENRLVMLAGFGFKWDDALFFNELDVREIMILFSFKNDFFLVIPLIKK